MEYSEAINEFSKLYEEIYKDLYKTAYYMLGNAQDAEDAVSEAVLSAYKDFHKLRNPALFKNWIFKILSNRCKRKLREYYKKNLPLEEDTKIVYTDMDESNDVRRAFSELEKEERMIVSLCVFGGYKSHEIGEVLSLNPNTVRSKYARALGKMQEKLEVWL